MPQVVIASHNPFCNNQRPTTITRGGYPFLVAAVARGRVRCALRLAEAFFVRKAEAFFVRKIVA